MPIVQNTVRDSAGDPVTGAVVTVELVSGPGLPGFLAEGTVSAVLRFSPDASGVWTADLPSNQDYLPTGTYYRVTEAHRDGRRVRYTISVPPTSGPHAVRDILVAAPPSPDPLVPVGPAGEVTSVDGRTGAVSLSDRYAALVHNHNGVYSPVSHTHTPASIGAADAGHTHTAAAIGAAAVLHTHVTGPAPVVLTDAPTIATDASVSTYFRVTLTANRTLGTPTNPTDGQRVLWELVQDATGTRTLTLGPGFALGADISAVVLSTAPGKRDFLGAVYVASLSKWLVIAFARGY